MESKELSFEDHVIATDMLFETKASIKDLATAITESTSAEVHTFLAKELRGAIAQHEKVYGFLQDRGRYDAYNVPQQLQKDVEYANQALGTNNL
ncbi:spore coat protein [Bacillus alkalicellulosilyticus]|uniref:spore coat protein n=1 Tax=Alkalihalobacterium alkalicellulosilyticum TaxID=1912214 RepID=UPI000998B1DE|nr:spore coat protein [Bacillus alkalicellulosilyticus]